jgi:hypothetical protein
MSIFASNARKVYIAFLPITVTVSTTVSVLSGVNDESYNHDLNATEFTGFLLNRSLLGMAAGVAYPVTLSYYSWRGMQAQWRKRG